MKNLYLYVVWVLNLLFIMFGIIFEKNNIITLPAIWAFYGWVFGFFTCTILFKKEIF